MGFNTRNITCFHVFSKWKENTTTGTARRVCKNFMCGVQEVRDKDGTIQRGFCYV